MIMHVCKNIGAAWRRSARLAILPLLVCMAAALNGCVSKDAARDLASFSKAVALTTSNSANAYRLVEQERFDAQFSDTLLNYRGDTLFRPVFSPFLTPEQLQLRLDVFDGLKTYAVRLSDLMNNPHTNLDQETTKLAHKLTDINQDAVQSGFFNLPSVSSNNIDIFAAGVNELGHWIILLKAQKACREAITNMQTRMPGICGVLEKDLDVMRSQLANDFIEVQRNSALYLQTNFNKLEPFQVRAELHRLTTLANAKKTADDALAGTRASVEKLAAAHQALDKAFTGDTNRLASLISAVTAEANRASSYYSYLQQTNN